MTEINNYKIQITSLNSDISNYKQQILSLQN